METFNGGIRSFYFLFYDMLESIKTLGKLGYFGLEFVPNISCPMGDKIRLVAQKCKEQFRQNSACSFLNMPRLMIQQRVWVCTEYARVNNAQEVIGRWPIYWENIPARFKNAYSN